MSTTPWWAVPLIAGVFAVGGVVMAQLVTIRLDRVKYRRELEREQREESRRWLTERREVYGAFIASMHRSIMHASKNWPELADDLVWEPVWREVMDKAEEVMLIGSFAASYGANELRLKVLHIAERQENGEDPDAVLDPLSEQLVRFVMFARQELTSGHFPNKKGREAEKVSLLRAVKTIMGRFGYKPSS
ncbi:hypothetical protein ACWD8I_27355 [Micromonospora arida]|uniref:hypothetical protein n=1 Tax=Micromonospora arida TaxID=2203715 RepID=UPI003CE8E7EB